MTAIAVVWFLAGIYNAYTGFRTANADLGALQFLSSPSLDRWFQVGVPSELVLSTGIAVLGLTQLVTIYGLWKGRHWSYRLALAVPILSALLAVSYAALLYSAPSSLGLASPTQLSAAVVSFIWVGVFWNYIRRLYVKEYLKVQVVQPTT